MKQDKKLGYATSTVKGDDLARTNAISPINALQGKVAGLQIQTSGSAGLTGSPVVVLRGAKSLTKNNSPIYVIDGIVMENPVGDNTSGETMWGNQLKNLNQQDFESVTVLKGAAATSIYGSRGANGAIVITSKSGRARKGIGVEVNYSHEFVDTYRSSIELQNRYGMGSPTNGFEGGLVETSPGVLANPHTVGLDYSGLSFGPRMDNGITMQQNYKLWPGDGFNPDEPLRSHPDNWKAFTNTGHSDNVSVALTGGSEKATYRLSYNYTDMKGSLPNNEFNRHSVNFRTNGKLNDIFSVDFSFQYSNSNALNPNTRNYTHLTTYELSRNTDLEWYKANYIKPITWERMPTSASGATGPDGSSALRNLQSALNGMVDNNVKRNEQTIITRLQLTANLTQWLDASASISYNDFQQFTETKNYGAGIYRGGGEYAVSGHKNGQYNSLVSLHSNNSFVNDNLTLDIRLMYEMYGNTRGNSYSKKTNGGLITPGLFNFSNSYNPIDVAQMGANYNRRNSMVVGVAGVVNLGWKDQIFLELTARNDWNSTLTYPDFVVGGANNYSVFYPSANASWIFSDTFNINSNVMSMGRLRASVAQVGSGTSPYETAGGTGGYNMGTTNLANGDKVYYANPNNLKLANIDLKPEIQQTIEFGADLRFLDGKIGIDVAYYKSNTYNQILTLSTVRESGVTQRIINAGNIQNQGWEVQLDFRPIQTNKVRWEFGFTWSRNRGKVVELHPDIKSLAIDNSGTGAIPAIFSFEGGAFGQIVDGPGFGYGQAIGSYAYYKDPNDPNNPRNGMRMIKTSGDTGGSNPLPVYQYIGTRNVTDYFSEDYKYDVLGHVEPDFMAGFTTTLSYAGFDLFAQIDGRYGGQMISPTVRYADYMGSTEMSLYGRDKENGGEKRINWKGEEVHNGIVMDGVFATSGVNKDNKVMSLIDKKEVDLTGMTMREAVNAGHIQPMLAGVFYQYNRDFRSSPSNFIVQDATYFALREVTLGYNFPERWIKHIGMQSARLSFTARNLCYIYNGLRGGTNPESLTSNNPLRPIDEGGVPFVRNFNVAINLRF